MASEKTAEQLISEFDSKIVKIADAVPLEMETPCLICGEGVPVFFGYSPKICKKCKAAVMKVREQDGK